MNTENKYVMDILHVYNKNKANPPKENKQYKNLTKIKRETCQVALFSGPALPHH